MNYKIQGEPTPVVICDLNAGETMITEKGSMVWMSPNMEMQTSAGGIGKAFGRMFSGESMFQNFYTAKGGPGMIAFASSFPGAILPIEITPDKPGLGAGGGAVGVLPEEGGSGLFRRRGLHYAEAVWPGHGLFGDRRLRRGVYPGPGPADGD